jgi:phospholipid/cholesterol/gamma-HCH transport system substrate-binding protein
VRYRGIQAGRVEDIDVDPQDPRLILVRISVDDRFPLTRGTTAHLNYQVITGLAYVELEDDGSNPAQLVAPRGGLPRLELQPTILDTLSERAPQLVDRLAQATDRLTRLLDDKNVRNLSRTLENAAAGSEGLKDLPRVMAALRQTLSAANLQRLSDTLDQLQRASAQAGPLVAEARQTMKSMADLSRRLDALADESQAETLPKANALLEQLGEDSRRLSTLLETLQRNPSVLVFGRTPPAPGPGEAGFAAPGK